MFERLLNCCRLEISVCISVLSNTEVDVNNFSMRTILRQLASLNRKLFRPRFCSLLGHMRTAFTGPPPTEPAVGHFTSIRDGLMDELSGQIVPKETDLAIVGGGLVGLCTAFFIKHRFPRSFNIVVIEKDPLVRYLHYLCIYRVFC